MADNVKRNITKIIRTEKDSGGERSFYTNRGWASHESFFICLSCLSTLLVCHYDHTVDLTSTGDRSEYDTEDYWKAAVVLQERYGHRGSLEPASVNYIDLSHHNS